MSTNNYGGSSPYGGGDQYGQQGGYGQQSNDPYGQQGGYGQQSNDPYGQQGGYGQQSNDPYGQQQSSGAYGQPSGSDYAQPSANEAYGQQAGGYGQSATSDYGQGYGQQQSNDPYGYGGDQSQGAAYGYDQGAQGMSPYGQQSYGGAPMRPPVGFGGAMKLLFQNALKLTGRANKGEFWWAYLGMIIINFVLAIIVGLFVGQAAASSSDPSGALGGLSLVYLLMFIINIPLITCAVRRLHDANKSGWWYFITLVPFGVFFLIYLLVQDSDPAGAQYDAPDGSQPATA